jgi:cytochrome d ubiquinol oxidase subunit II
MRFEILLGVVIIGALTFYALLGGADYGGGIWDLFSVGPRGQQQRDTISRAITPVWEANHVWLILIIVLLWTGLPPAFTAVTTALHIPVLLVLFGVIFRGVCFTFRNYDTRGMKVQRMWGYVFSIASLITPFLLGVIVGAITKGDVIIEGGTSALGFVRPWFSPFPLVVGGFAVALFAYLAAAYLTVEAGTPELQDDFRKRAILAGVAVAAFALLTYLVAMKEAPEVCAALIERPWSLFEQSFTAIASLTAFWSLYRRKFYLARFAVAAQTALILWGWALAQYPFVVQPRLTLSNCAAPAVVEKSLLIACAAGALILFPSIAYMYRVFKEPAMIHDEVTH